MYRQIPNQLTILRLILAALFFLTVNWYRYPNVHPDILWAAIVLFCVGAASDVLDGYLARKWKVESTFGRIMDPFCDKVLVIGAFMYLSGPRFVIPEALVEGRLLVNSTGIYPWMVAVMLARELLVQGIRGELEGSGVQFAARLSGKLKMVLQSLAVPIILIIVWIDPHNHGPKWLVYVPDVLAYVTVIVTAVSGVPYVTAAVRVLQGRKRTAVSPEPPERPREPGTTAPE